MVMVVVASDVKVPAIVLSLPSPHHVTETDIKLSLTLYYIGKLILTIEIFVDFFVLLQRRSFVVGNKLNGGGSVPPSSK